MSHWEKDSRETSGGKRAADYCAPNKQGWYSSRTETGPEINGEYMRISEAMYWIRERRMQWAENKWTRILRPVQRESRCQTGNEEWQRAMMKESWAICFIARWNRRWWRVGVSCSIPASSSLATALAGETSTFQLSTGMHPFIIQYTAMESFRNSHNACKDNYEQAQRQNSCSQTMDPYSFFPTVFLQIRTEHWM